MMSLFYHSPQYLFTERFEQALFLYRGIIERLPEINQVTVKYMKQASSESSKTRRITLISAPTNE